MWGQARSLTVHPVILTNAMVLKGPVRELISVGERIVRLLVLDGQEAAGVRLLRAGVAPGGEGARRPGAVGAGA